MKLPVPHLGAAADGFRDLSDAVMGMPGATARAVALLPRIEALVTRIEGIASGAATTLARANAAIDAVDAAAKRADTSIDAIDLAARRASDSIGDIEAAIQRADATMTHVDQLFARTSTLLGTAEELVTSYAGPLRDLAPDAATLVPALRRIASTVSEREVDAAVGLIDQLPHLLATLKTDVLPVLERLGPDVHATMEIVDDVRDIINGLPGAGFFRRRGEEVSAEEDTPQPE
ncbi:MAG: hypothetical protein ABIM89_02725 [Mycobacteriales bacterium]